MSQRQTIVSPSALAADFLHLDKELAMIERSEADWLHVDVMDGVFVPNISMGSPIIKALKKGQNKPYEI